MRVVACIAVLAIGLVLADAVTCLKLWRSPLFERSQKIAQTVLIWLIPGTFLLVRYLLRESMKNAGGAATADPTVNRDRGYYDENPTFFHSHGPDGGGHGF
jgi:hypothetical protein